MGTVILTHAIATMDSQEYIVYFRALMQRLAAPDPMGAQGQAVFVTEFSRVDTVWLAYIIAETHSQEYNVYSTTIRW